MLPNRLRLLGLFLLALAACHEEAPPPDLLLITIDTQRSDFLSSYGYPRSTTPAYDRLAADGVLFEHHYATVPQTAPSHASILTGLWPREHGLRKNGGVLDAELPSLPALLADAGWQTRAVVAFKVLDPRFGFARGFEQFDAGPPPPEGLTVAQSRHYSRDADEVIGSALELLASADPERPLLLWVHLFDPHDPYEPHPAVALDAPSGRALLSSRVEPGRRHTRPELIASQLGYEGEVTYTSRAVGRLLKAWDRERGAANSVVALTADHGEGLGEHDLMGHGFYLYEEQLHVPLILRAPGRLPAGVRVEASTSAVDLAATLLPLVGLDPIAAGIGGEDLAPYIQGGTRPSAAIVAERPVYNDFDLGRGERARLLELKQGGVGGSRGIQLSLLLGRWKLIWSEDTAPELYDLEADPAEALNLAEEQPDVLARLVGELDAWRAARRTPADSVLREEAEVGKMLEALGY